MLKKALSGLDRLFVPQMLDLGLRDWDLELFGDGPFWYPATAGTSKESSAKRYPAGTVVEVHERLRSGWTKWLRLAEGGWLFDISPKDRKVRMVEVEVQHGLWKFEVCTRELVHLAAPNLAKKAPAPPMHAGEVFSSDQKAVARKEHAALLACRAGRDCRALARCGLGLAVVRSFAFSTRGLGRSRLFSCAVSKLPSSDLIIPASAAQRAEP
ncbi:unnamed protein product [Symbiodinium sp. KB8]|nr:unnamed protein product [Symbiodinium sp. KB8]